MIYIYLCSSITYSTPTIALCDICWKTSDNFRSIFNVGIQVDCGWYFLIKLSTQWVLRWLQTMDTGPGRVLQHSLVNEPVSALFVGFRSSKFGQTS